MTQCIQVNRMLGVIQQLYITVWHMYVYTSPTLVISLCPLYICVVLARSVVSACSGRLSVRWFTAMMMMQCIGQDSCSTRTRMANTLTYHCVPGLAAEWNQQESLWKSELKCIHTCYNGRIMGSLYTQCVMEHYGALKHYFTSIWTPLHFQWFYCCAFDCYNVVKSWLVSVGFCGLQHLGSLLCVQDCQVVLDIPALQHVAW